MQRTRSNLEVAGVSGRDGCCRFNLRKSEKVIGAKFYGFKESLLGTVKVFEEAGYWRISPLHRERFV
jgi:hypothetical protein